MSRIITAAELQNRSLPELQSLFRQARQDAVRSAPGSAARRNALASLDNISLAIARRMAGRQP